MIEEDCDPTDAAQKCCELIEAYLRRDGDVEGTHVEKALDSALSAFGLPPIPVTNDRSPT